MARVMARTMTIDLCDRRFLETWKPTKYERLHLGKFRGWDDYPEEARSVAAEVGAKLYAIYNDENWSKFWTWKGIIGVQGRMCVALRIHHWPPRGEDDGGTEVEIVRLSAAKGRAILEAQQTDQVEKAVRLLNAAFPAPAKGGA
jgi:hypothetical protein